MSSFGGVSFKVFADRGRFPSIERDAESFNRYHATILLASMTDRNALAAMESRVTPLRIYGRLGGNLHLEGGAGVASLVVPFATGVMATRNAILVGLTNIQADGSGGSHQFRADADWILVS